MTFSASDSTAMLCDAAYNLYREYVKADEKIAGFVVFTQTGRTARILSRYRPKVPVYAFTTSEGICESLSVNFGVFSYLFDYKESKEVKIAEIEKAIAILEKKKLLTGKGKLIAIHGDMWGQGSGATTIRII
jgi:pyruvate kinase